MSLDPQDEPLDVASYENAARFLGEFLGLDEDAMAALGRELDEEDDDGEDAYERRMEARSDDHDDWLDRTGL